MEPPLGEERVEPFWKRETSISSPRRRGTGGHNATALSYSMAEDGRQPHGPRLTVPRMASEETTTWTNFHEGRLLGWISTDVSDDLEIFSWSTTFLKRRL